MTKDSSCCHFAVCIPTRHTIKFLPKCLSSCAPEVTEIIVETLDIKIDMTKFHYSVIAEENDVNI